MAVVAGTGDVVHCRQRGGNANSGRGAAGFLTETFNRARAAGAITLRADSGFYSGKVSIPPAGPLTCGFPHRQAEPGHPQGDRHHSRGRMGGHPVLP